MSVLVDTGVLFALFHVRDEHHQRALRLMDDIRARVLGRACTTTFVVDEFMSLCQRKGASHDQALRALALVGLSPGQGGGPVVELLEVTIDELPFSIKAHERLRSRGLSFTDCTHLATMRRHRLEQLATFDSDFDGLVPVVADARPTQT